MECEWCVDWGEFRTRFFTGCIVYFLGWGVICLPDYPKAQDYSTFTTIRHQIRFSLLLSSLRRGFWHLLSLQIVMGKILMLSDCISDGNQCESNMCSHGDCVDMLRAYACRCHSGYEGKYCEYRESECLWLPRSISNVILKKDCTKVKQGVFNIMKLHQATNHIFN